MAWIQNQGVVNKLTTTSSNDQIGFHGGIWYQLSLQLSCLTFASKQKQLEWLRLQHPINGVIILGNFSSINHIFDRYLVCQFSCAMLLAMGHLQLKDLECWRRIQGRHPVCWKLRLGCRDTWIFILTKLMKNKLPSFDLVQPAGD